MKSGSGSKSFGKYELQGKGKDNEDTDINNNIGVTTHGVRPDSGAATVAGADERNENDNAGEREEHPSRARAEQAAGKTLDGRKRTWTDGCSGSR